MTGRRWYARDMIVVAGSPAARLLESGAVAGGLAATIAIAAAKDGAAVEIVGRVGDDGTGDAVLQDLATAGVGHVAILRTAAEATPLIGDSDRRDDDAPIAAALDEPGPDDDSSAATRSP